MEFLLLAAAVAGFVGWWYFGGPGHRNENVTRLTEAGREKVNHVAAPVAEKVTAASSRVAETGRTGLAQVTAPVADKVNAATQMTREGVEKVAPIVDRASAATGRVAARVNVAAQTTREGMEKVTGAIAQAVQVRQAQRAQQRLLPQQFKEWVAGAHLSERPELFADLLPSVQYMTAWVQGLAPAELRALTEKAADLCGERDVELAWLLSGQLDQAPELKPQVEQVVALSALACWKAMRLQGEARVFAAQRERQSDPASTRSRELTRTLFTQLLEKGLVPPAPPALLLAPEEERQAYLDQALREFQDKDAATFNVLVHEAVLGSDSAAAETEPPDTEPVVENRSATS